MSTTGLPQSLDAWRSGKVTESDVEAALAAELAADPALSHAARDVIETYRRGGRVPEAFALRLLSVEPLTAVATTGEAAPGQSVPARDIDPARTRLRAAPPLVARVGATNGGARPPTGITAPRPGAASAATGVAGGARPAIRPSVIGSVLAGQYVIESVVAGGQSSGFGVVYKARDLILEDAQDRNPYVAIKVLDARYLEPPGARRALRRAFNDAQQLSHPNIVKVQNYNVDGASAYIVMELLEGRLLSGDRGMPEDAASHHRSALKTIAALTRALKYAHELKIVHGDFKPQNVFVTSDGAIKVLNFALAQALRPHQPEVVSDVPTPVDTSRCYASGEQLLDAEPEPRDDVYALGVVSYELLTGRHPYEGRDALTARGAGMKPAAVAALTHRQWNTLQAALYFTRSKRPRDAQAFSDGMAPRRLPVNLLALGGIALVLVAIAAAMVTSNVLERRRIETITSELTSSDSAQTADAVARLLDADQATVDAVLSREGAANVVLTVFERRARSHFDPARQAFDLPSAKRELATAKRLLKDSASLRKFEESLETEAR